MNQLLYEWCDGDKFLHAKIPESHNTQYEYLMRIEGKKYFILSIKTFDKWEKALFPDEASFFIKACNTNMYVVDTWDTFEELVAEMFVELL